MWPGADGDGRRRRLTRPEIGILLAQGKLLVKQALLRTRGLLDDPSCEALLFRYFPARLRQQFSDEIRRHPLRSEIIASELANALVDTMGGTFVYRLVRDTGADVAAVSRAWMVAWTLAGVQDLMESVAAQVGAEPAAGPVFHDAVHGVLGASLERLTRWILRNAPPEDAPADVIGAFGPDLRDGIDRLPTCFSAAEAEAFQRRVAELEMVGLTAGLARELAVGLWLDGLLEAIDLAGQLGVPWERAARLFYGVGAWLALPWIGERIAAFDGDEDWQHRAVLGLADDLTQARRDIVRRLCLAGAVTAAADAPGMPTARAEEVVGMVTALRAAPTIGLPALYVVAREIRRLATA
jgi:glutamate dehydrogenase